ncbi:MAG: helix-turn-helix transcriptional regulator [Pseudomonadota bacterium]
MNSPIPRFLTTRELAALLRIKERKVYELVAKNEVPCSKATGKLLFPQDAVNAWLVKHGSGFSISHRGQRPSVALGSHDPLLEWAIRESGCGLATFFDGSSDGVHRFANGEGVMTGLHLYDPPSASWNIAAVEQTYATNDSVLLEFAWRERGLLVAKGNPLNIQSLADLGNCRIVGRQKGAGAEALFRNQLIQQGVDSDFLDIPLVARTETETAAAISTGEVDTGFGLRSVADQFQLEFIPVTKERFDLLIDRHSWFESPLQTLFAFMRSAEFRQKAISTPGYHCEGFETVHFNAL